MEDLVQIQTNNPNEIIEVSPVEKLEKLKADLDEKTANFQKTARELIDKGQVYELSPEEIVMVRFFRKHGTLSTDEYEMIKYAREKGITHEDIDMIRYFHLFRKKIKKSTPFTWQATPED